MPERITIRALILLLVATSPAAAGASPPDPPSSAGAGSSLRLEYDNDALVNSDNKFTNGASVQWHSNVGDEWQDVRRPEWMKFGRHLPGLSAPGLDYRIGLAVGQNIQSPSDLSATEPIPGDVPYAGALGFELNWIGFNDDSFRGYALIAGVVGPASGGEAVQKWVHDWIGAEEPRGWDNQLPNEPVVNFNAMFKEKLLRFRPGSRWSGDLTLTGGFGVGTALTFGEVAAEVRAGRNLPYGFAFVPDPIGRSIAYDATVPSSGEDSLYVSLMMRRVYTQHFIFTDGSLFQDTPSVATDPWRWQLVTGLHWTRGRFGLHVSFWDSSASLRTPFRGSGNDFGTIAFEWRL